jgi:Flp pilus assembly pilin Flp
MINARELRRPNAHRERGASLVEYALLIALVAIVAITAVAKFGSNGSAKIDQSATALQSSYPPSWVSCAVEGGTCTMSGTHPVRYGDPGSNRWATSTKTGSFGCNNSVFGDPAVGIGKVCDYDSAN